MLVVVEEMGNSLKFHHFWLKVFILFDRPRWGMSSGSRRPGGLCFARAGHSVPAFGTLQEGARQKGGGPPWEPGCSGLGGRRRRQLMSFANCQGLQVAKPQAAVAGPRLFRCRWICFGTRKAQHLLPAGPGGAQVAGKSGGGILKGHLAKHPRGGRGRESSMKFPRICN